ncbi:MAG: DUF2961 domain-containing protein [Candidatus Hydrogenedentes bacterium]|nr:DUF2961 domain-containing protein [Candidatus Hydrogenedentota bacterium]
MRLPFLFAVTWVCLLPVATISAQPDTAAGLDALTRAQQYEARRESSNNPDFTKNGDARSIDPGAALVLADLDGPGIVTHFWNTVNAQDPFYGRSIVLRMYYDGADKPSVEAPLGDFFGVGHGAYAEYTSLPVSVSSWGRSRNCYWRIPFLKHLKVTVTNESPGKKVDSFYYYLDWQKHTTLPGDTHYFHARYRQQMPAQPGNYTILDTQGSGHYVGTVYSAHQVELGWFGEGDDYFYIDGAETPQLRGTGTEDYFNDAWGFRAFSTPYYGVSLYEGVFPGDRVTAYRWHIADPIPFTKSLKVDMEHKGSVFTYQTQALGSFLERPDWVSSVAFWYQFPAATWDEPLPPADQRIAPYRLLDPAKLTYKAEPPALLIPSETGITYAPGTAAAHIDFEFEVEAAGRYQISGIFSYALMAGIFQASMDGKPFGQPLDFAILNADNLWKTIDLVKLEAGKHTLTFTGVEALPPAARNLAAPMHAIGIQKLILLRLEDMEGFEQLTRELTKKPG